MKKLKFILLAFPLLLASFNLANAQTSEGVKMLEQRPHSVVYEVKVKGMTSSAQATLLEDTFKSREGVMSASVDEGTDVCTVEVKTGFNKEMLVHVVEACGLVVAKSFED